MASKQLPSFKIHFSYPEPDKSSKLLRFVGLSGLFLALTGTSLKAQTELFKFQEERSAEDGQVYVYEGLANSQGDIVVPADYEYIWQFNNDTITLARKRLSNLISSSIFLEYQLITKSGYLFYEFPFYLIPEPLSEGTIRIFNSRENKFGFLSKSGEQITKYKFQNARDFKEGMAAVLDPKNMQWGYINKKGKLVVPYQFEEAYSFSEGLSVVKKNGLFYYCSLAGELTPIQVKADQVFDLREGFSIFNNDKGYGIINKSGQTVLDARYAFIDNFDNGIAVFVENNQAGILDNTGKVLIQARYEEIFRFDQKHYLIQQNGLKGLISNTGETVIPASYSAIDYFSEGLAPVMKAGKWGFTDTQGDEIIPCQFAEYQGGFQDGKINVRMGDQWKIKHGNDTISLPQYDEVLPYYGYTAAFRKDNLWGFLNIQGEESIEPKYSELIYNKGSLIFGKCPMADGSSKFALINAYGKEIIEPKYIEVVRFTEGYAAVKSEKGWGFINENGSEIVLPQYDEVRNFSSGRAAVRKGDEWGFISGTGHELIPMFTKLPDLSDAEIKPQSFSDSLNLIREVFPLYQTIVVGDFNGSIACVEDLTAYNDSPSALVVSKTGKILTQVTTEPFQRLADSFITEVEMNPSYQIIKIAGSWITINNLGQRGE